jgi:hypothetical protein
MLQRRRAVSALALGQIGNRQWLVQAAGSLQIGCSDTNDPRL